MTLPNAPPAATHRKLAALMRTVVPLVASPPPDQPGRPVGSPPGPARPIVVRAASITASAGAARPGNRGGSVLRRTHDFAAWAAGDTGYDNAAYDHVRYTRRARSCGRAHHASGQAG